MTVDPSVVPGLLFLLAELVALTGVGYVIVLVTLRETDRRIALAQGLVVGPAIWGVVVNLVMYVLPGMPGAIAGWVFVLALAAVLVWRSSKSVRPRLRVAAVAALAVLAALFWIALASRQQLTVIDVFAHLGLAASIRAGGFPPELPWNPGTPAPYHYGIDLLLGLLTPPFGPNLAFVVELLGAYAWMSLVLVVGTAVVRRGGWFGALILTPLLLATGAWTFPRALDVIDIPIPAALPAAGIRASLTDIYWPTAAWPLDSYYAALPNIWKPSFPLAYALAFVVLQRAALCERRSWPQVLTLAVLVGFIGLTSSSLAPIVLLLWAGLEAIRLVRSRRSGWERADLIRPATGLALAALLMGVGGGVFTTALTGSSSVVSLGWTGGAESWRQLGSLDARPGGVALLGLGPLAVAGIAALMAWRDRLVLALIAGAFLLIIAVLVLRHDPAPYDLGRLAGHARNFALFALLLALSARLHHLRSRRRYAAGAALAALVVWPTIAAPVSHVRLAMRRGIDLANAGIAAQTDGGWFAGRYKMRGVPEDIATYIQKHIAVDARVFSPRSHELTYATGRPNASGFDGHVHILAKKGPAYLDVRGFLEPRAVRRLGFEYVHAPESWVESLPSGAADRLNDPSLFELLVRNESESLYRVLPGFLDLDAPPAPESYEALRQAVPASTTVFLSAISGSELSAQVAHPQLSTGGVRAQRLVLTRTAHALSHARLLGTIDPSTLNLRTPWKAEPLGEGIPDLVIMPLGFAPWMFPAASREPIWWNDETAVYALGGSVEPIMRSPPVELLQYIVRVSNVSEADGRITFTATFDDGGVDQWSGQDWVVVAIDDSPLGFPTQIVTGDSWTVNTIWFSGQILPDREASSLTYEVDLLAPSMAFRYGDGAWTPAGASESGAPPGIYALAMRLRHEFKPNQWRDAAIIPVLRITVSETGEVSYQVHKDAGGRAAD